MNKGLCRFCQAPLHQVFANLGSSPLANSYLEADKLDRMEPFFPLIVYVCDQCFLVQVEEFQSPEGIFSHYSYFSSFSDSWLDHSRRYADAMIERWKLGPKSQVIEVASNDGYLLQFFKARGIPILGVEPAANVAEVARGKGIPTEVAFFGVETAQRIAKRGEMADLIAANNVLAHVPNINDFVQGFKALLKPGGVVTVEFQHFLNLMELCQFDTIYHEHFSYLTLSVVERIYRKHGLKVFDVEELPTHGGSLRIYGAHLNDDQKAATSRVAAMKERERRTGLEDIATYSGYQRRMEAIKVGLLKFLVQAWESGKHVAAYGAPAKGNTLLNYCGIKQEFVQYTVDRNPHKAGSYLPGSRIPIYLPEHLRETKPDYLLILPWNIKDEIVQQTSFIREWGGSYVTAIPRLEVFR